MMQLTYYTWAAPSGPARPAMVRRASTFRRVSFAIQVMSSSVSGSSKRRSSASAAATVMRSFGPKMPSPWTRRSVARCETGTLEGLAACLVLCLIGADVARVLRGGGGTAGRRRVGEKWRWCVAEELVCRGAVLVELQLLHLVRDRAQLRRGSGLGGRHAAGLDRAWLHACLGPLVAQLLHWMGVDWSIFELQGCSQRAGDGFFQLQLALVDARRRREQDVPVVEEVGNGVLGRQGSGRWGWWRWRG